LNVPLKCAFIAEELELEVKEKEIRKSNPIVILGGKVAIWMAVTSGVGVLV
jgi:hypothetical protein